MRSFTDACLMTSARRYAEHLRDDVLLKLFYLGAGFVPVLCISLAGMDVLPLHVSGPTVVLPLCVLMLALGFENRNVGGIALRGLISGVIAVTIYDFIRLSFIHAGLWNDFVPGIGRLLLRNPHAHWLVGYAWRFILNGGCLGIPFAMLGGKGWKAGAGYGVFVCSCLFTTLIISPHAQVVLFELSPLSAAMALVGHLVYGAVLGACLSRFGCPGPLAAPAPAR